tara:strand:+ start:589 stop:822 length:234 start_codon:yes stop_codon:yes gene_type:complete
MKAASDLHISIGDEILVLQNPNNDETFRVELSGQQGMVKYFDFECGCGQTYPNDPMIGVQFNSGVVEEYWKEEIMLL